MTRHPYDPRYLVDLGFWDLTDEQLDSIANGCGAKSARIDLVPDCIMGSDINLACDIHDFEYWRGVDKAKADREFLHNLCLACFDDNTIKYTARTMIAFKYFQAVVMCGASSFGAKS